LFLIFVYNICPPVRVVFRQGSRVLLPTVAIVYPVAVTRVWIHYRLYKLKLLQNKTQTNLSNEYVMFSYTNNNHKPHEITQATRVTRKM